MIQGIVNLPQPGEILFYRRRPTHQLEAVRIEQRGPIHDQYICTRLADGKYVTIMAKNLSYVPTYVALLAAGEI